MELPPEKLQQRGEESIQELIPNGSMDRDRLSCLEKVKEKASKIGEDLIVNNLILFLLKLALISEHVLKEPEFV